MKNLALSVVSLAGAIVYAQVPNPTQDMRPQNVGSDMPAPIYRITVVSRSVPAVSYRNRSGWTKVDLHGTALAPQSTGHADVNSRKGYIEVKAEVHKLGAPSTFGPEYLTYVIWAITPEGRANNLGELLVDNDGNAKLDVTTELQAFALIVTAEPYFGVTQPSDVVVMENLIRGDTVGKFEYVDAKFDLLQRGQYTYNVKPGNLHPVIVNSKTPLELFEARNAVFIALYANADKYAGDVYSKAKQLLDQAEAYEARKAGRKPVTMTAREAVQTAENARIIAVRRMHEEDLARERQAAADREARAKANAEEQARLKAQAEKNQLAEAERRLQAERNQIEEAERRRKAELETAASEQARRQAQAAADEAARQKAMADAARAQAETEKAQAEAARAQAEAAKAEALKAQQQLQQQASLADQRAQEADRLRLKAEQDQQQLRQQLLTQLNLILETRDTARGLIINMSDVLFDTGRYTLKPGAREKLAKISGIVLAHPTLKLEVEGHTDSVGGDAYNQTLSEQRARAVQEYLVAQGVSPAKVTAKGFGKTMPVADNNTPAGRQRNRRVELVVSGEEIGGRTGQLSTQIR
jgi:outer membrane protein OmpA-like peptidoglycan-associated protein